MYSINGDDLLVQVLPVEETNFKIKYDEVPCSANEYLLRVRAQAQQYEEVKVADLKHFHNKLNFSKKITEECLMTSHKPPPAMHWQIQQIDNFSCIRLKYEEFQSSNKEIVKKVSKDVANDACYKFLYGNSLEEGHEPLLSTIIQFDQMTVERLVEDHIGWMQKDGFSHRMGEWLYSLLVAFEKPLSPDACWLLRRLAKQCAQERSKMDGNEWAGLSLIICIVSRYFEQRDLADVPL